MEEKKYKNVLKDIIIKIEKDLNRKLGEPTLTINNRIALGNCFSQFKEKIAKEDYLKKLFVKAETEKDVVKVTQSYFKRDMNKALNKSNNEEAAKLLRYLKDALKKNATLKIDFKYYDVSQKELIDKNARVYGDINWKEDYKKRGVFQKDWIYYIKEIKNYDQLKSQESSEKKPPYSSKELINGTKRLLSICEKYLSPKHIFKGVSHWINIQDQTVTIDPDKKSLSTTDEIENIELSLDVENNFPEFIKILQNLSEKERNCYLQVLCEIYKETTYPFDKVMKNLNLNNSQNVKNNYMRAGEKIKKAMSNQNTLVVFGKFMQKYFDYSDFRTLVDSEIEKRRTK